MWNDEFFVNEIMNAEELPQRIAAWKKERTAFFILALIGVPLLLFFVSVRSDSGSNLGLVVTPMLCLLTFAANKLRVDSKIKMGILIQKLREQKEVPTPSVDAQEVSSTTTV